MQCFTNPTPPFVAVVSLTSHGVVVGAGSGGVQALTEGATNTYLAGVTGANPVFQTITYLGTIANKPTFSAGLDAGSSNLTSVLDPVSAQDAATKNYVDQAVASLAAKDDCQAATTTALAAATYNNGSSGVGATLTLTVAAVLVLDGYTPALNDRLLIKNQADAKQNGIYVLSTLGTVIVNAVLTRATDFNQPGDGINGALVFILQGTTNGHTLWYCTAVANITFGSSNINFSQFTGTTYTADETTVHLSGTTFSIISTYVGQSSIVTVGTLTGGATGAGFTVALGTSTITGILGSANGGTGNGFTKFSGPTTSEKTFTLPNASTTILTTNAAVTVAQGGTGLATLTAHALYVGNGTSAPTALSVGANNTVLRGNTGADPSFGAVVEADITLADNTTNNASTSAHGFLKKLSSDATQYMDGTGAYSVPGKALNARLTGDYTNATATMSNLTDLTLNGVSGATYCGTLMLTVGNSVAAEGVQIDFNGGTATFSSVRFSAQGPIGSTAGTKSSAALGTAVSLSAFSGTNDQLWIIAFAGVCSGSGTIIPRAAENSHSTGTLTIRALSFFRLEPSSN